MASARAASLVGGSATIGMRYTDLFGPEAPVAYDGPPVRFGHHAGGRDTGSTTRATSSTALPVSENFFVAEPQANVLLSVTDWMRIDAGVGYRFIGGTSRLDNQLGGVSGSIAVQFGGGGL